MDSGNVTSECPGTNQVDGISFAASSSRMRGMATRGPNSPCENFTGGSPRRTESEMAS